MRSHPRRVARALTVRVLAVALSTLLPHSMRAQSCAPVKTGLVLSGGGAKGFAHIGLFKVLDSLHIRPDFIVGSSIGAIAGALYASGYTGNEIDSLTRALPIANVIRSYSPTAPGVIGALPAFAVWENNGAGYTLQTGAVREGEVNALMSALMLHGNLLARGDFDRLPIPLRVIGTRLSTRKAVVLSKGDLAQAVRASFAIPLIFSPGVVGGDVLMDGGVSDNIPVAAARAMGAQRLIISTLPTGAISDDLLVDPLKVALRLTDYLFVNDTTGFQPNDIVVRHKTADVNSLDFSAKTTDMLVTRGAEAARESLQNRGCLQTLRDAAVAANGAAVPVAAPTVMSEIHVNSTRLLEDVTLRNALGLRAGRPFREDSLRNRLLQLGSADDYRALWLTPSGKDSSVSLSLTPVYGAKEAVVVGFAYDNDLGGRLWGASAWRDLFHASVEGAAMFDISKYRQEFLGGLLRRIPAFQHAAPLVATARLVSEDVRVFDDSLERAPIPTREVEVAAGLSGRLPAGITLGVTPSVSLFHVGDRPQLGAVGMKLLFTHGGGYFSSSTRVEADVNTRFQRVHLETRHRWQVGSIDVIPRARLGWSHQAPVHQQFVLGGYDGFGGLRTTERRGAQEAMVGVTLKRQLFGPVRGTVEGMLGAVGVENGFLRREPDTIYGQRITGYRLGAEMRIGPIDIRVARGFNTAKRDNWFIRMGPWF